MQQSSFCPCGKDVTDIKFAYHKYMCPLRVKRSQSAQSHSPGARDPLLPNKTDSQHSSAAGNSNQKKVRPRTPTLTETVPGDLSKHQAASSNVLKVKTKIDKVPDGLDNSSGDNDKSKTKTASRDSRDRDKVQDDLDYSSGDSVKRKTKTSSRHSRVGDEVTADLDHSSGDSVKRKTKTAPRHSRVRDEVTADLDYSSGDSVKRKTKTASRHSRVGDEVTADLDYSSGDSVKRKTKTASRESRVRDEVTADLDHSSGDNDKRKTKTASTHSKVKDKVPDDLDDIAGVDASKAVTKAASRGLPPKSTTPESLSSSTSLALSSTVQSSAVTTRPASLRPSSSLSGRDSIDTRELDDFVDRMVKENVIGFSEDPKRDVNKFFDDEVKMTQCDITNVQTHFNKLREKIIGRLNCETELGGWVHRNGGSHADGTKVARPDEMDCILYPRLSTKLQAVIDETCHLGFCKVKVVGTERDEDLGQFCDGEFLNSRKFRSYVFDKLQYIVDNDRKLTDIRKYSESLSFAIKYTGIPTETGMKSIDMDFVPSVHISQWPRGKVARDISTMMSDKDKAQKIKSRGFNATPKQCFTGPKEIRDLMWQMSFSYAEKRLTKHADKDCWKPVLRTIKRVVEIAIGNSEFCARSKSNKLEQITKAARYARENYKLKFESRFTTYHIRTLMWTLLYDLSAGEHTWTGSTKATKLRFTLEKLRKMLTGEMVVPHFFLPEVKDIMCGVRSDERKFLYIIARATEIIFSKKP